MQELIIPALNFSILVALLSYFGIPIFRKSVADRRETIKKLTDEARKQKLEAESKYREFDSKLKDFESEAQRMLAQATTDAEQLKARIIADAKVSAENIVKDADSFAKASFDEFKEELRREAINRAITEAEGMIRSMLSKDVQSKIIREYVEKVQ